MSVYICVCVHAYLLYGIVYSSEGRLFVVMVDPPVAMEDADPSFLC